MKTGATIVAGLGLLLARGAWAFTPGDVSLWAGSGTNESVLVVDWHDGATPEAVAWGFRWNGAATVGDLMKAVTDADARLAARHHPGYPSSVLFGLGYDADDDGGRFAAGFPFHGRETGYALDIDDRYREGWVTGYWSLWRGVGNPYAGGLWNYAGTGFSLMALTNGSWIGWGFDHDFSSTTGGLDDRPRLPAASRSPHATRVEVYAPGLQGAVDPISGDLYTNATTALGPPAVDTTGGDAGIPLDDPVAAVPVYPAFRHFEVVTVGENGELVLSFDHPVTDDPRNPYGADFIVYGNTLQELNASQWTNGSPHDHVVGGTVGGDDSGRVSVSQDGANWFVFTSGPDADAFAPTLGRRYDPDNPDPALGASNAWWGASTDPRWPLDPSMVPADFAGLTVAEMCRAYGRSAGGTAFDLASLPLPVDPGTGRKWFRYLRVEQQEWLHPEVDAVSDVAPAKGYEGWALDHFTFWQRTNAVVTGEASDPDGDGWANLLEYVVGREPWVTETEPLFDVATRSESNGSYVVVGYERRAELIDTVVLVEQTSDYVSWSTTGVDQAHAMVPTTGDLVRVEAWIDDDAGVAARLRAYRP